MNELDEWKRDEKCDEGVKERRVYIGGWHILSTEEERQTEWR